jgi:acetyl esterase
LSENDWTGIDMGESVVPRDVNGKTIEIDGPHYTSSSGTKPYVRPDVQAYLDMLARNPRPAMNAVTVGMIRKIPDEQIAQMMSVAEMPLGELEVDRSVSIPGPAGPIGLRLFDCRPKREYGPVLMFYHGGGFVVGSIATHAALAAEMARQFDLPVISVEYRLAPEHRWPAAAEDAEAAARWVAAKGAQLGVPTDGLILAGDSAGATLALGTALSLRDDPATVPVILTIPLYPMADASRSYASAENFASGYGLDAADVAFFEECLAADNHDPRRSAVLADLQGFPPTVLVTAALDPLRDGGRALATRLIAAGVPTNYYEAAGNIHGFATYRKAIASAQEDLAIIMKMAKAMLPTN